MAMPHRFQFDPDVLRSVAGGRSAIDIPRLNLQELSEADAFLSSYGFDLAEPGTEDKLWYFHRRALVLLTERLGFKDSEIPEVLRDRRQLGDLRRLLLFASSRLPEDQECQRWSCAILRGMHVYVHAESDLFSSFSEEIQAQILTPIESRIYYDGTSHKTVLKSKAEGRETLELAGFHVKPFKTSTSTVIKLLAKPDALAMKVFDKLGVRFITKDLFDSFQVIRFLVEESLISFPHIMPDQSSNNFYPVEPFLQVCADLQKQGKPVSNDELAQIFRKKLEGAGETSAMFRKPNEQSGEDFRFIKFITRKLIRVQPPGKEAFSFFYPFEVQIMDEKAQGMIASGPSDHDSYKERQRQAARRRIFPTGELSP